MLPLWAGAIPAGIAYGLAAHAAGLSGRETQLMSLIVFSAAAQLSTVSLIGASAPQGSSSRPPWRSMHRCCFGLAVGRQIRMGWCERLLAAWFLTDGAYGVAVAAGLTLPGLLGAGVSMYVAWNVGTALELPPASQLDLPHLGVDLVALLTFLAVLVPLVRTRPAQWSRWWPG